MAKLSPNNLSTALTCEWRSHLLLYAVFALVAQYASARRQYRRLYVSAHTHNQKTSLKVGIHYPCGHNTDDSARVPALSSRCWVVRYNIIMKWLYYFLGFSVLGLCVQHCVFMAYYRYPFTHTHIIIYRRTISSTHIRYARTRRRERGAPSPAAATVRRDA